MSLLDKVIAAVTPPETDAMRIEARQKAIAEAIPGGWLEMILDHHVQIEDAFAAVKAAQSPQQRRAAQKWLGVILTGHANAEESVIYPAMASNDEKGRAELGYQEQAAAKGEAAALEELDPMSEDYDDKLEHLRGAVAHHMFEEEGNWFTTLQNRASPETLARLNLRYTEEFKRYVGNDTAATLMAA